MKPTDEEVQAEIAALKELLPRIIPRDSFGGDNKARLQYQIDCLSETVSERRNDNQEDPDLRAEGDYAFEWLNGTALDGKPSENWELLVKNP